MKLYLAHYSKAKIQHQYSFDELWQLLVDLVSVYLSPRAVP